MSGPGHPWFWQGSGPNLNRDSYIRDRGYTGTPTVWSGFHVSVSAFATRSTDSPQRESRGNVDFKTFLFYMLFIFF